MSLQFGLGLMSVGALIKYSNSMYYAIRSKQYGENATGILKAKVYKGGFQSPMTRREALLILGLREATAREPVAIKESHSKLMISNHPDMNGSNYLASKINEAKDFLVKTQM